MKATKAKEGTSGQAAEKLAAITGHEFRDAALLAQALTHASAAGAKSGNYERLEFLGDRVLGLLVAEMLYQLFPQAPEGQLSARLNMLVNAETCAEIAVESGLAPFVVMSADMKKGSGRRLINIYADVAEALIAALYLDAGLSAARGFISRYWRQRAADSEDARRDAKTELQEWAHKKNAGESPVYQVLRRKGPDHDPVFEIEVRVGGFAPARGSGSSKRQAEQEAAEAMLRREHIWA